MFHIFIYNTTDLSLPTHAEREDPCDFSENPTPSLSKMLQSYPCVWIIEFLRRGGGASPNPSLRIPPIFLGILQVPQLRRCKFAVPKKPLIPGDSETAGGTFQKTISYMHSHRIHVWYIYLQLVDFYGTCAFDYGGLALWVSRNLSSMFVYVIPGCAFLTISKK